MRAKWWAPVCAIAIAMPVSAGNADAEFGFFDYLGEMVDEGDGEWTDLMAMVALDEPTATDGEQDTGGEKVTAKEDDDE